jgi:hypothetical protein
LLVLRGLCHLEGYGEGGNGVVVGATLVAGEDGGVDFLLKVVLSHHALLVCGAHALAVEDHGTAGAAQGLVGGGGDDVGVLEGGRHDTGSHETRDVSHVNHQERLVDVGHLTVSKFNMQSVWW